MKRKTSNGKQSIILSVVAVLFCFLTGPVHPGLHLTAQVRTSEQLTELLQKVEASLNAYTSDTAAVHSAEEIRLIEKHIQNSITHLQNDNPDGAYLEIKLAIAYLELIEANQALYKARKENEQARIKYKK